MTAPTLFDDDLGGLPAALAISGRGGAPTGGKAASGVPAAAPRTGPAVVGADPSLTATGLASTDGWCYSIGRTKISTLPLFERQDAIDNLVEQIVRHIGHPDLVVMEHPLFRSATGAVFDRYSLFDHLIRALRAVDVPLALVNVQTRMRYATGSGAAKKGAIVDVVARRLPMFATGGDDNMADAAILCAMGADHLGTPLADMPPKHRAALDAVEWPTPRTGAR